MAISYSLNRMCYGVIVNELHLEGEFDKTVLRAFNHQNVAFEQLRNMGLEHTGRVSWPLKWGRGRQTFFTIVAGRKKVCTFSHALVIMVMPIPAASVLPVANNYLMSFQVELGMHMIDFVHRVE